MATIWGTAGNDTLTGNAEDNTIGGGDGDDLLTGNSGRDLLMGGDGNDTLAGGGGNDWMQGGAGSDHFVLAPGGGWDYIADFQAGAGGDVLDLTAYTGIAGLQDVLSRATAEGSDTIITFSATASLRLQGVALASLTAANFRLAGGEPSGPLPASNTITGTAARDLLSGTAASDVIIGGGGNDWMVGGAGSDHFVINPDDGWDAIGDFQAGTGGDVLDLRGWSGLSFEALVASATENADGLNFVFSGNTGVQLVGVTKASLTRENVLLSGGTSGPNPAGPSAPLLSWGPAGFDATAMSRIVKNSDTGSADQAVNVAAMSAEGRYLAYGVKSLDAATPQQPYAHYSVDLYLKDLQTGAVSKIDRVGDSIYSTPLSLAMSDDGSAMAYSDIQYGGYFGMGGPSEVRIRDLATGNTVAVGNGTSVPFNLILSGDGDVAAFQSKAYRGFNGLPTIHYDTDTGTKTNLGDTQNGLRPLGTPALSADGNTLVFARYNDVPADVPGGMQTRTDLVVRNMGSGAETLFEVSGYVDLSAPIDLSADGRFVLFSRIQGGSVNILDTATGAVELVSAAADGTAANGISSAVKFSADGRSVVFSSTATNLDAGDTNGVADFYVKNLDSGAVRRITAADGSDLGTGYDVLTLTSDSVAYLGTKHSTASGEANQVRDVLAIDLDRLPEDRLAGNANTVDLTIGGLAGGGLAAGAGHDAAVSVSVAWGDGQTTTRAVTDGAGSLSVNHLYAGGTFAGTVTLTDAQGRTSGAAFRAQVADPSAAAGAALTGDGGTDLLVGGRFADTLTGGAGDDYLSGGLGDDWLSGGDGSDVLVGGAGSDTLTGGAGADLFVFGARSGIDVITDFDGAGGDRLRIGAGQAWTVESLGADALVRFSPSDGVQLAGIRADQVSAGWFVTG
ncbi:PD40 domain-containing protein [Azospirillum sp. YIM B02556]|uniref:PD40 domain-containing protein n=1 Tax=Azospirillum endophyticum TaxID=2800326 RepID=A0ABS1F7Q7_9PROT|nr:PD40 domain-containing protein [Azospirillum endophyticum]MBK1839465.1 PD40 domain-containing protein [Azospirillum endophyticum]